MLTTREVIKTFYNALIQRLKKHRGNWEQNDPTADDYIKNRPFYTDDSEKVVIVPNQQITFSDNMELLALSEIIEFVVGQSYEVKWDDVNYTCNAWYCNGIGVIGNRGLFDGSIGTGEPFIVMISEAEGIGVINSLTPGTHTVEVTSAKIVKIDKKYLPDDIIPDLAPVATSGSYDDLTNKPTIYADIVRYDTSQSLTSAQKLQARTNISAGTSSFSGSYNDLSNKPFYVTDDVLLSNTTLTTSKHMYDNAPKATASSNIFALNKNQNYKIVFNNVLYNCIDVIQDSNNVTLGNCNIISPSDEDNGMPFAVYYMPHNGNTYLFTRTAGTYTLSISMPTIVCIDEKYIPDTIQRVADMPTDYVTYTAQTLTEEQQKQVRTNIGAGTSNYNDLINTPIIDNTLTISGAVADAKAVGDAVTQLTEQKADKSELEKLNTPKNYIILIDQVNGFKYRIAMRDGVLVSYVHIEGITVTSAPAKTTYMAGEYFNSTGLVISTVSSDGSTVEVSEFVVDETYVNTYLTEDVTEIGISYTDESGEVYTTVVPITVTPFDPAVVLVDFEYTANDNGTYTITGWKETLNGESSTEMIIPNNGLIII